MFCPKCGTQLPDDAHFCSKCGNSVAYVNYQNSAGGATYNQRPVNPQPRQPVNPQSVRQPPAAKPAKKASQENIPLGILGAFLGALVGAASIVLFSKLGYVAAASGFIILIATFFGYTKLGKNMSWIGVIVCLAFSFAAPYVAERFCWALVCAEELGGSVIDEFLAIGDYLEIGIIDRNTYEDSLLQTYLYCLIGFVFMGFSLIRGIFKK